MTSQYHHRQFLRRMPNESLEKYFAAKGIELGVDFNAPKAEQAIFDTLTSLPEEQQATIETEFQDINAMASEGGVAALIDEAKHHQDESFVETIADIVGFHAKVMWAYIEKPEYWRAASLFQHADNVCTSYWKKRNDLPAFRQALPCTT